ncbi:MAG: DUF805 domain-containing protein, partial [Phenylobacterium sp.]
MDYVWYVFRFEGRLNRANFWLAIPIILCLMMVLGILVLISSKLFGGPASINFRVDDIFSALDPESYRSLSAASLSKAVIKAIGTPLFLWIYLAIAIKRLHDRNKSGWWMLLFFVFPGLFDQFADRLGDSYAVQFVAFVVCVWGFVELCFLRGTKGTNRFGADPLA